MSSKYFKSLFITLLIIKLVTARSFTIVVDTTVSMQGEMDIIRSSLASMDNLMDNVPEFEDFIIVPFNDPDVGPPIISKNPNILIDFFDRASARGGDECPEDSLAGIQMALEKSKPNSFVYVFTDAHAKDVSKFRDIENFCRNTRSQVVIFLSGGCSGSEVRKLGYVDIYYDIAKSCSGAVFKFDSVNLRKAFNYVKEMINTDFNDIINHEPFSGYKQFTITIDSFTSDFLIAISGDYPTLQLVDADEKSPELQKIVDTRQSLVVRIANLRPGQYQASIRCQGLTSLTFYKKSQVPYQYGFSTRLPNSLQETSLRPMPGRLNYMLKVIPKNHDFKITSIEQQTSDGNKTLLSIEESQIKEGFYTTSVLVDPNISFRMTIHGRDSSYQETMTTTKVIEAQGSVTNTEWTEPMAKILEMDNNLIDFATNATIVCKVIAYPEPEIVWEDNEGTTYVGEELLLEIPSTYLSYVTLNATSNHTMHCKATNKKGTDEQNVELYVNRTYSFDIIQTPQNETFEYGAEGKLYCQVNAYPEAEVKWSHNDTSFSFSDNIDISKDEDALIIKNMTLDDVGLYECKVSNEARTETFKAEVSISGLEVPELEVDKYVVDLKPGDWVDIKCRVVKGNPPPETTWKFQAPNGNYFDSVPSDIYVDGPMLKISEVKKDHKGTYKCIATNILGEDSKEISIDIKYSPIISSNDDRTLEVKEGSDATLPCEVDATPEATVRWETPYGDATMNSNKYRTDDHHTLRFNALWKDSGLYRCIAENEVGRTEEDVTVNVLVAPYIQPTESRVVTVAHGSNVTLPCNVLYGNPVPSTKWEFIATDSVTKVLSRGNSSTAHLYLNNVSRSMEGMYLCIAENEVGNDRIRMDLRVN
ncbi:hypothetical protein ABMA27_003232 [Loxostege sticticalis]|uniref:Ig-like domain-containing protein n=1 Tax=Loxostege sticticalis TaxID=481309 RepID=A0ABR3HSF5_LOXSC